MKALLKSLTALLVLCSSFAFTLIHNDGFDATYTVSPNDPSNIELRLNKDFTFSFQNFSNPEQKIKVQGKYIIKNGSVHLSAQDASTHFHNKWKLHEKGMKASSRKGLTFYTLRKK